MSALTTSIATRVFLDKVWGEIRVVKERVFGAVADFALGKAFRDVEDAEGAAFFDKGCAVDGVVAVTVVR